MSKLPEATTSIDPEAAPWYLEQANDYDDVSTGRLASLAWRFDHRSISMITIGLMLGVWQAATSLQLVSPLFLPSPIAVFRSFVKVWNEGFVDATLLEHLGASLGRIFVALFLAVCLAVPIGLSGRSERKGPRNRRSVCRVFAAYTSAFLFATDYYLVWYWRGCEGACALACNISIDSRCDRRRSKDNVD